MTFASMPLGRTLLPPTVPSHRVLLSYCPTTFSSAFFSSCFALLIPSLSFLHNPPLYLYTIFDQRRVDIIGQVECNMYGVHDRLHTSHLPPVWDLLLPLASTPTAFSVSSERHWQSGVKEIAKVSKRPLLITCQYYFTLLSLDILLTFLNPLDMHPLAAASRSRLLCSKRPINMRSALNVSLRKT